ncbi:MAG: hypothetical protein C0503_06730 [Gemmatimonas sp.]|nr:hypothetical protein [Gemmatimonas sp.]
MGFQRTHMTTPRETPGTAAARTPEAPAHIPGALFEPAFDRAFIPTAILDRDGRCCRANAAFATLLGLRDTRCDGLRIADFLAEDAAEARELLAQHLRAGTAFARPVEVRLRPAGSGSAWASLSLVPLDVSPGSPAEFMVEMVDRTELHETLIALRESEQRLALALEATTDGVWDWDFASGRLVVNARWATMLGYAPGELEPHIRTWEALANPEDVPRAYAQLEAHAAGRTPQVEFEMRMRCKDGSWLWILNRAKVVARNADGSPARIVGTHSDIQARKTQDEATRRQTAVLDTVLSNIPIAIDIVGADGQIEYVNAYCASTLGWSLEEMRQIDVMAAVYPDPEYRARVVASIAEGSPDWQDWQLHTRDGRVLTMSWSNVRLADGRVIGIGTDVTALRAAEATEERNAAQLQEAQKLESLGLLAGGIAHDFNNLLVGVLGNASLAEESLPPNAAARELVAEIRDAATRAADLTRQLLAYAGKGRFLVEPVDISVLVGEMAALLRAAVSKRAVLKQELTPGLPGVQADATQLRQVVMNLITNASDALPEGAGHIVLRTRVVTPDARERESVVGGTPLAPGRYLIVEVEDDGIGMDRGTLDRIFDPFFTTKQSGHGLGLAATLGIVRSHHGAIAVQSAPGKGTTMRLYLPAMTSTARPSPSPLVGAVSALRGYGTILLADDEPAVRDVSRRALQRAGFEVVACGDGQEALEMFRSDPDRFSALVLDLTMPRLDGEGALLAIRELRPNIPAVLSSGYARQELRPAVAALSGVAFVQKPFTVAALTAAIFEVCPPKPGES